jgi:hypothetical protein
MSQPNVERLIGLLATDEQLRRQFLQNPRSVLSQMAARGMELNPCETRSLLALDPRELERFAAAIDPRLQKSEPAGGGA